MGVFNSMLDETEQLPWIYDLFQSWERKKKGDFPLTWMLPLNWILCNMVAGSSEIPVLEKINAW